MFGGIRLISSPYALKDSDVRLFPESKNRSARIHKKLVKRFGGEFKKVPAIFITDDTIIAHPEMTHLIRQEIANANAGLGQRDRHGDREAAPQSRGAFLAGHPLGHSLVHPAVGGLNLDCV